MKPAHNPVVALAEHKSKIAQGPSMADVEQRIAAIEQRVESAFALDARLKALESDVRKLRSSSLRDWAQTLGPYVSGLVVLLVGFSIKDSVTLALQREQLDLEYVKQMRDLIQDFDEANSQAAADANAVGLAMYGKYAIIPLVERLEGGDVAPLAAERGLRLVGGDDPAAACPKFIAVITDRARRFKWQTHKTMIKVIGQSSCTDAGPALEAYGAQLTSLGGDATAVAQFARRYAEKEGFDVESAASLQREVETALEILASQGQP
jgi:hypothetical protein